MFQFPGFLSHELLIHSWMITHYRYRISPFGYPRIVAFLPLPVAFRRLMRPSSAVCGQAFTVRPSLLNHFKYCVFLDVLSSLCFSRPIAWIYLFLSYCLFNIFSRFIFCFSIQKDHVFISYVFCYLVFKERTASGLCFSHLPKLNRKYLFVLLSPQKGGDPSPRSRRDTLLRLNPSHRSYLRRLPPLLVRPPASGIINSHGLTGGVYKARERIHRGMLIRDYQRFRLHAVELQTAIRTTIGFLGLAPPPGFAALCSDHCMTCEALAVRAMRT